MVVLCNSLRIVWARLTSATSASNATLKLVKFIGPCSADLTGFKVI